MKALLSVCSLITLPWAVGQTLSAGPNLRFTATADSLVLPAPQEIGIGVIGADSLAFKFGGVIPSIAGGPNFVVVSPSSGIAPARATVALNPNVVPYLGSGSYALTLGFTPVGGSSNMGVGTSVFLTLTGVASPTVTSVVNAASLQPAISPGSIVSIFGANLSTPPTTPQYDSAGLYPTDISHVNYEGTDIRDGVTFNGVPAPLLYASTGQIFPIAITDTSPGIFTVTQNGNGPGAILNAGLGFNTSTINSVDNPAAKGSAISFYATGSGLWNRPIQSGSILLDTSTHPAAPVSLTIGGQPATIIYAGAASYRISGEFQVNAIVPSGVGSGLQPVVLTVGQNSNAPQQVTVAIQ